MKTEAERKVMWSQAKGSWETSRWKKKEGSCKMTLPACSSHLSVVTHMSWGMPQLWPQWVDRVDDT